MQKSIGLWMGCLFLLVSGLMLWMSFSLDYYNSLDTSLGPGPGLFPRWLSGTLLLLSILYIAESLREKAILWSTVMPKGRDMRNVITATVALILLMIALPWVGFVIAGSLMLFILLVRFYPWHWATLISVTASLFLYFVFNDWLKVPLPTGVLLDWGMANAVF
ncbi:MAG: hypothetical protein K0Q73_3623 [Paenibacillus sp.]|jgi:hypothetical protein|nr:hypothetical protein [Paenibacillus sp.]